MIILDNLVVLFFAMGFLLVNVLELLLPGRRTDGLMVALWAIGTVISDLAYRRWRRRSLFDLETSTVFWVVPSWAVGVALLALAARLYFVPQQPVA